MDHLFQRTQPSPEPRWVGIMDNAVACLLVASMATLGGLFVVSHLGCGGDEGTSSSFGGGTTSSSSTSEIEPPTDSTGGVHAVDPGSSGEGDASADASTSGTSGTDTSTGPVLPDSTETGVDASSTSTSTTADLGTSSGSDSGGAESTGEPIEYQPAVCYLSPCSNNSQCAYGLAFENMCFGLGPSMCTRPCDYDQDCAISCEAGDLAKPPGQPSTPAMRCDNSWCKPFSCTGPTDENCDCREWWPGTFYCHADLP